MEKSFCSVFLKFLRSSH